MKKSSPVCIIARRKDKNLGTMIQHKKISRLNLSSKVVTDSLAFFS